MEPNSSDDLDEYLFAEWEGSFALFERRRGDIPVAQSHGEGGEKPTSYLTEMKFGSWDGGIACLWKFE